MNPSGRYSGGPSLWLPVRYSGEPSLRGTLVNLSIDNLTTVKQSMPPGGQAEAAMALPLALSDRVARVCAQGIWEGESRATYPIEKASMSDVGL
jgi:hypothetical protein